MSCNQYSVYSESTDLLIKNVTIIDGSGSDRYLADVRIRKQRIEEIGQLERKNNEIIFQGNGLILSPGFIDTHSHADGDILSHPDALAAISQGITTVIVGQDGFSPYPLKDFIKDIEELGVTINIGSYVGHNTIRYEILKENFQRMANENEVVLMAEMLKSELSSGAIGLSTGLEYDPGIHSNRSEVITLAQVTADAGGRYISHIRSEDRWFEDAIDEIIEIGRRTKMPVQISHLKMAQKSLWYQAPRILEKLDQAVKEGINITADLYPYEYWQSNMMVLLPERDPTDRNAVALALDQIAPPEGIWLTRFDPEPDYVGKTIVEIAKELKMDPITAFMQLAQESKLMGEGSDMIIGTSMVEEDIRTLLLWEHTNVCSDGGLVDLHPRGMGSFTKILGKYVREEGIINLETAIRKMTGLAADHMGFNDRGYIRIGQMADLVLFNPDTVIDNATPESPDAVSDGIFSVWVGGEQVFIEGKATKARPGKFIIK
ncbi:MAG: N-acyl-D-amino-acid deacylase [Woeseiaceae bacterium]|jgi:N-acyl-D-amino-acid deacylase|tara:strand:+ start:4563 stop:6029 length:1467 start_codon:yes stop_codon:yes gene_type:complete